MNRMNKSIASSYNKSISRRDFMKYSGLVIIAVGCGGLCAGGADAGSVPRSQGYLVVDTKKCQGCLTCMLACSLAHEGEANLSLARIQVLQNPFEKFPYDISQQQCRQCAEPACLTACPSGALHVDAANGNVRTVDSSKCIGCKACVQACPYDPGRSVWNFVESHAQKCDLCGDTPHWSEQGGVKGKQACVELCPMKAIAFRDKIFFDRYEVNLRDKNWAALGYPRF